MIEDKRKIVTQVLGSYYQKGNEHLYHCPYCNHHKKKMSVNFANGYYLFFRYSFNGDNKMKLTEAILKQLINEVLAEGMKTHTDLPEDAYIRVHYIEQGEWGATIAVALTDADGNYKPESGPVWGDVRFDSVEPWGDPCGKSAVVSIARAADGWGPLLYDVAIEVATIKSKGLTPDRHIVSQDAADVWDFYLKNRSDVVAHQLDDMKNTLTPEDEDNCTQKSAGENWQSSPLSKRYTKEPTIINSLGDKLKWEI